MTSTSTVAVTDSYAFGFTVDFSNVNIAQEKGV
jgi:hypothetical protein